MPLNKFIAQCGISSRRKAADLVKEGKVTVDGVPVTEPATRVTGREEITLEGKRIRPHAEMVYVLLNKPRGYITSLEDPQGRKTVMELVRGAANTRIYPVGRLDRNTSGLLLLTNDGELAQKLAHPSFEAKKVYQVTLDKPLTQEDYRKILTGVELEDGLASVDAMEYLDAKDGRELGLEIHLGRNRIVRRIFEHLGYNVEKLDRVMYAGLTKKQLPRGTWRLLGEKEVILLKYFK
ncbi:MAG TPA: pseudouridine synthase [Chitinophagaceae bacterium]|nr:pseudouridine synthase [Chitinophagaceae bacterium]